MRSILTAAAILFVLSAYAYFASYGRFEFRSRTWDAGGGRPADAFYASLAEGFRRGQLGLAHKPVPELMAMPHPYDYEARTQGKVQDLWDASYFNGRYYLYFTPLPALLFYLPHAVVYGAYPGDQLAAAVFAAWAFIAAAFFLKRAIGDRPHIPLPLWIVMLGLGNVVPFIMVFSRTYEVAALCGAAMTATWAWSVLRYLSSPATSRLIWMTIWLGLSIAARPNLGILLPVAATAIVMATPRAKLIKTALIASIPLAIIGSALLVYNYARFHDPFEFGIRYQLTYHNMAEHRVCGLCSRPEALRAINNLSLYLFSPPYIGGDFPYADLSTQILDWDVSFGERSEEVGGLAPVIPLAMVGSVFGMLIALRKEPNDTSTRAALLVLSAGWLALVGLSTCWFVTARYEVDFMLLITAGAIICIERGLTLLKSMDVSVLPLRIAAIVLACYSTLLGILIAFKGTGDEFGKSNPELFKRLSELF